jgi:hypothetical protein
MEEEGDEGERHKISPEDGEKLLMEVEREGEGSAWTKHL